jgi:hypothetical protein
VEIESKAKHSIKNILNDSEPAAAVGKFPHSSSLTQFFSFTYYLCNFLFYFIILFYLFLILFLIFFIFIFILYFLFYFLFNLFFDYFSFAF